MDNWKYLKVFVSSTFLDMDIERDALKNIVEPRLNEFLKDYACNIEFIDLRHSVKTTKDMSLQEREKQIFNICLEEIDNCRPYFMGIIGHRYGWIPSEDGVACPPINIPEGFPVDEQKLSVTMYEFLHGILSPQVPKEQTIIFLRKKDSYIGLTEDQLSNYLEKPDHKQYIKDVRDYIKTNDDQFKVVDYTLPIGKCPDKDLLEWTELVYNQLKDVVKHELNPVVDEFDEYAVVQESYVQEHLKSFCGREKEQKECMHKIEHRGGCIIAAQERGLGLTSFYCKMYDNIRRDKMNICLIYCPETRHQFSPDDAIIHWLYQLDRIDGETHKDEISKSKGDQDKMISLWEELTKVAQDKGYKVFLFCETISSSTYFKRYGLNNAISVTTIYYTDNLFFMRPMMYMIEPYEKNTLFKIIANQRQEVKEALLQKKSSSCAAWLKIALTIIEKMNKIDFLTIRNRDEDDNETRIIQHQVNLVKELPEDKDEMILFWTQRLKNIFGSDLMDNYLFLMSLNSYGWGENLLSEILDCDMIQVTTLRQMLGRQIVNQAEKGLWSYADTETEELLTQKLELKTFRPIAQKAYQYIGGLQQHLPVYEQTIFKLAMLSGDILFCSKFMENHLMGDSPIAKYSREGFVWFATQYKYDYLNFVSKISAQPSNPSYQFFYNLLQWSKMLSSEDLIDEHLATAERIISNLKILWQANKINLKTYSVVCDALACRGDYYRRIKDYKKMFECIDYGLVFSKDYYKKEDMFLSYYHYCIHIKHEFLYPNRDDVYFWLEKTFIMLERKNEFSYSEKADITVYALLLHDAAEIMVETGHTKDADKFCMKSFRLLIDFLRKQENKVAETILSPADTRRNLVVSLLTTIRLYYHYDFLTWEQLSSICDEVFDICHECRLLKNKDISYEHYYRAKAAYYFIQDCDDQEKFTKLMDLADDILKSDDDSNDSWKFDFLLTERNKKHVDGMFESWLYVNSLAMYVACDMDNDGIVFDGHKGFGMMKDLFKKEDKFVFDDHLKLILPYIGAKEFDDNGMPPRKIWDAMLILYVSMLFNEANKDMIDLQYLVELFNSANDLSNAIIQFNETVPMVKLMADIGSMKEFINDNLADTDAPRVNLQARYHDFSDSFGISGDIYTSDNGFWANGDPELIDIDN